MADETIIIERPLSPQQKEYDDPKSQDVMWKIVTELQETVGRLERRVKLLEGDAE